MEKQIPSLGRVVLYANPQGDNPPEICAAKVVHVHNDENINLVFWNKYGTQGTATSVVQGEGPGRWNWPPFVAPKKIG